MLFLFELGLCIYGIVILCKGRIKKGLTHEVVGSKARIIGLVYLATLPIPLCIGIAYGIYFVMANNRAPEMDDLLVFGLITDLSSIAFVLILANVLTSKWKQPVVQQSMGAPGFGDSPEGNTFAPPTDSDNPFTPPSNL